MRAETAVNYWNYFTEVEEHFSRQRGRNLLVAPLDWCLIDLWKSNGVPLHVALRGIDRSFQSAAKRGKRPPTTLFYCHPAVMEAFEEYSEARLGAPEEDGPAPPPPLSREEVLDYLNRLRESAASLRGEAFQRVREGLQALVEEVTRRAQPNLEEIDQELRRLGEILAERLLQELDKQASKSLRQEARAALKIYRKRLSKEMYAKLEGNYLARLVRERHGVPEFSLLQAEAPADSL